MAKVDSIGHFATRRLFLKNRTSFEKIFQNIAAEHDRVSVAAGMIAIYVAESPIPMYVT